MDKLNSPEKHQLEITEQERDLGIQLKNNLK